MVFGCRPSAARPRPTSAAGTPASTCSTARSRRISRVWWSSLRPSLSLTTASVTAPELGVKLPAIPLVTRPPVKMSAPARIWLTCRGLRSSVATATSSAAGCGGTRMVRLLEHPLDAGRSVPAQAEDGPGWDTEVTRGWLPREECAVEHAEKDTRQAVAPLEGLVHLLSSTADGAYSTSEGLLGHGLITVLVPFRPA